MPEGRRMTSARAAAKAEVDEQLKRILRAPTFQRSERLRRFLEYIVDRGLDPRSEPIREVDLALDVFDKRGSFDSRTDPIVRVEARRLRKALDSYYALGGADDPLRIVIPSRGYTPKFLARTSESLFDPAAEKGRSSIRSEAGGPSIAVLPFLNMTHEPSHDIFCQGVTEELINALTKVDDFKVVSRTSVYQFKDKAVDLRKVGKELGVQNIVEGSVRADGERLRITAQLSSSSDGFHIWSETFDATLTDPFKVQEGVAREVAEHIAEQLATAES